MYKRRSVKETKYLGYPNRSIVRKKTYAVHCTLKNAEISQLS